MTNPLSFDDLQAILHQHIAPLPDHRKPSPNTRSTLQNAVWGAFGIFFTQSPSFLEYQRRLQHTKGRNNAQTLLGVTQIPCDNQIRTLLDPLAPSSLDPVFLAVFTRLEQHHMLDSFRVLGEQLLVALDGTNYFASQTIHGPNCLTRQLSNGPTLSDHAAIPPVSVCPGRPEVLALPPESIMPQDGHDKQDCAQAAGTRWLPTHAPAVAPYQVTLLGADLSSKQPCCALARQQGLHCLLVCKPDSHATLYERLAFWQANDGIAALERRRGNGRCTAVRLYRYINDVLLRGGDEAVSVNWFELTLVKATTGEPLSHNSFITNPRLNADNVVEVAQAGRGRWKIENENNNVLKTKGYHLAHNFGHGQQYLAAFLLSLNLLAFLFHTVLEWSDEPDALLRRVLARRQTFFEDIQAWTRYMVFDSWHHLMDFMIQGLEIQPQLDTSWSPKWELLIYSSL
jgi:hypothetical protein